MKAGGKTLHSDIHNLLILFGTRKIARAMEVIYYCTYL
jgi:hypothetical protein